MRRGLLVLCLAGLLLASPTAEAAPVDAGAFRGSYTEVSYNEFDDLGKWKFSQINFTGTLTAGSKTYVGEFFIAKGLIGYGWQFCGPSAAWNLDTSCFYDSPHMTGFTWAAISGNANGQSLTGSCGGPQSSSYPKVFSHVARSFNFRCAVKISGSGLKMVTINGNALEEGVEGFAGVYTALSI